MGTTPIQPSAFFINTFAVTHGAGLIPRPIQEITFQSTYDPELLVYTLTSTVSYYVNETDDGTDIVLLANISY
jgi:hypothetical protein